jgi:hypothetical protein
MWSAAMNATVACRSFLRRQQAAFSQKSGAGLQIDPVRTTCRGRRENSNAATERWVIDSRFIAASGLEAVEIFYPKIPPLRREAAVRTRYAGANPKTRSKRLM